nr:hypothetical protein CFP56_23936 [Quercus suber]
MLMRDLCYIAWDILSRIGPLQAFDNSLSVSCLSQAYLDLQCSTLESVTTPPFSSDEAVIECEMSSERGRIRPVGTLRTQSALIFAGRDHLTALKPNLESGFVVMGGASLDEPITEGQGPKANGSILLAVADSKEEVVERLGKDPYVTAGVWDLDRAQIIPFKSAVRLAIYQVRCKSQLHEDTSIVEKHHHIRIMSAQNICSPDDFNRAHCTNEHYCSSMGRH